MYVSEKRLLDNMIGKSKGDDNISILDGDDLFWNYRNVNGSVCMREDAVEITASDYLGRVRHIPIGNQANHPMVEKYDL